MNESERERSPRLIFFIDRGILEDNGVYTWRNSVQSSAPENWLRELPATDFKVIGKPMIPIQHGTRCARILYLGSGVAALGPSEGGHTVRLEQGVLLLDTEPRHEVLGLCDSEIS